MGNAEHHVLKHNLLMSPPKALGLRPEGSNGAVRVFRNLSINKSHDDLVPTQCVGTRKDRIRQSKSSGIGTGNSGFGCGSISKADSSVEPLAVGKMTSSESGRMLSGRWATVLMRLL